LAGVPGKAKGAKSIDMLFGLVACASATNTPKNGKIMTLITNCFMILAPLKK
jgi:hypothetical protein